MRKKFNLKLKRNGEFCFFYREEMLVTMNWFSFTFFCLTE